MNVLDVSRCTPLHWSCTKGHLEIVKLLVEHKADIHIVDNQGDTAERCAADNNHREIASYLAFVARRGLQRVAPDLVSQ